jgi:hypothetical protein
VIAAAHLAPARRRRRACWRRGKFDQNTQTSSQPPRTHHC